MDLQYFFPVKVYNLIRFYLLGSNGRRIKENSKYLNAASSHLPLIVKRKRLRIEPLYKWWGRLDSNQRCFKCHGFTVRCNHQLCVLPHVAESVGHEPNAALYSTHRLASVSQTFRVRSPYGWDGWTRTIDVGFRDRSLNRLVTSQYCGRGRTDRTSNLRFWRPLLCQLSYTPE